MRTVIIKWRQRKGSMQPLMLSRGFQRTVRILHIIGIYIFIILLPLLLSTHHNRTPYQMIVPAKHFQKLACLVCIKIVWQNWSRSCSNSCSFLQVTCHSKNNLWFPPSIRDFFVINYAPINARVSGYLDLKFHNLTPFCIFSIDFADF